MTYHKRGTQFCQYGELISWIGPSSFKERYLCPSENKTHSKTGQCSVSKRIHLDSEKVRKYVYICTVSLHKALYSGKCISQWLHHTGVVPAEQSTRHDRLFDPTSPSLINNVLPCPQDRHGSKLHVHNHKVNRRSKDMLFKVINQSNLPSMLL